MYYGNVGNAAAMYCTLLLFTSHTDSSILGKIDTKVIFPARAAQGLRP
jgi:hypothetical protein